MTLQLRAKVILYSWSYDFNDTTLSTATFMQRHMINFLLFQGYEAQDSDPIKIGSQFIMAKKNASFLHLWYESYITDYRRNEWTYNALEIPGKLSKKHPNLIHVPIFYFTRPATHTLIHHRHYDWSLNYAIHIFQRYYRYNIDESVIRHLNTTMGSVARHVLFNNKELCL